jgi:choline dehydrogenase-like flavoprotein
MDDYDVIIIGTGAGGGMLARHVAPSGKRSLMLERGGMRRRTTCRAPRRQQLTLRHPPLGSSACGRKEARHLAPIWPGPESGDRSRHQ